MARIITSKMITGGCPEGQDKFNTMFPNGFETTEANCIQYAAEFAPIGAIVWLLLSQDGYVTWRESVDAPFNSRPEYLSQHAIVFAQLFNGDPKWKNATL